jgi:D-alanyl-D-alanine carboxypeptidase
MTRKILVIAFLAFAINVTAYGQNVDKAKLDSFFNVLGANNKQMGSIAISAGGKLVYQNAIG